MTVNKPAISRGRPRIALKREQIADAGIAMGLPSISIVGVAALLEISHVTLYTYVASLEELKQLVAEEIFLRWSLEMPDVEPKISLEDYMESFSLSLWRLVEKHPGIAPYLLRADLITPAMVQKTREHQQALMQSYKMTAAQSHWLFLTVSHVCVAVADTLIPPRTEEFQAIDEEIPLSYILGTRALIIGALSMLPTIV